MINAEKTLRDWLRTGITPRIPRDRSDAEPCTVSECLLFRQDAPHPDWKELQEIESWLGRPEAVRAVAKIVTDILRETGTSEERFNDEYQRRLSEYVAPSIDAVGLHAPIAGRQDVQLSTALEAACAIIHGRTAA